MVVSVSRREEGGKEEMKKCGKELRGERRGGRGEEKGGEVRVAQKGREVLRETNEQKRNRYILLAWSSAASGRFQLLLTF
ncbi:hypothetical protein EYF80_010860 [Liparis tanakae]|uniref:Uncharacterized protein n=1 Tax=Liparis tanakae TaxID=230148 RepID=A0A4Z2IN75_9TELE|nr:hypothetical protein EYF80_010860 [Liparis tanakae]